MKIHLLKHSIPVRWLGVLLGITLPALHVPAQAAPVVTDKPSTAAVDGPFRTRAFHVGFRPKVLPLSFYTELLGQLTERGYNTVILNLNELHSSPFQMTEPGVIQMEGGGSADIRELIRKARALRLEPILELKMIGKQEKSLGELARKLPGLLRETNGKLGQVLNPGYVLPDGRDVFQAIVFPEIDWFIGLYGKEKPKYFFLGIDEFAVDDMAFFARQKGTAAAALFAESLNRITAHVLAQGVTPIIWGDMLLSRKLAQAGHGVNGFDPDPRLTPVGFAYHAEYQSKSGVSVLTAMNGLRQRDQIIVADWQYWSVAANGDYPSVDYFQKMGFKDVWGTTWFSLKGIRDFSRYAARQGCGGMIASTWHTPFTVSVKHHYPVILNDSAVFFKNPAFTPPVERTPLTVSAEGADVTGQPPVFSRATKKVVFRAVLPAGVVPREPTFSWRDSLGHQPEQHLPMTYLPQKHQVEAVVTVPDKVSPNPVTYDTKVAFTCEGSGWYLQDFQRNSFTLMEELPPPTGDAPSNAWFHADFSGLSPKAFENKFLRAGGKYGALIVIKPPSKPAVSPAGALACDWTAGAYAYPPAELWDVIYDQGLQLRVEFQAKEAVSKNTYSAILSYGGYSTGFRILLGRDHKVLLQFAGGEGDGRPLWITFPQPVTKGQWTSLEMTLSPPDKEKHRTVAIRVGAAPPMVVSLTADLIKSASPLGLGVEFKLGADLASLTWPLFPGLIRKVELAPAPVK